MQRIVDALAATGELDSTLLIFTSDNGMEHGEHRIPFGKNLPYEETARVPLLMRGPGIRAGVEVRDLVANVDLAPTILDATGAKPRLREDGRSLLPLTRRPGDWSGRSLAIEGNRYRGVRTARYIYVHWIRGPDHGATELYDLERDPYELRNLHGVRSARRVERALAKRLRGVERCAGKECLAEPGLRLHAAAEGGDSPAPCPGGVVARVVGKDADQLVDVSFTAGRSHRRGDRTEPFRVVYPERLVSPRTRIGVLAELRDGRRMTLADRPRC